MNRTPPTGHHPEHLLTTLTAAAIPLTAWGVHTLLLRRRLAAAQRDPLTRALRRDAFTARATRLLKRHDDVLIGVVDLDHFKILNDTYGHAAGDDALAATADRLTAWGGEHSIIGRLGGDEFAFAARLPAFGRTQRLQQLARQLALPVPTSRQPVTIAASVGAAAPDRIGSRDLSVLMRAADTAMYAGKHTGQAVLASPEHAHAPTINGRRAGRHGTTATAA